MRDPPARGDAGVVRRFHRIIPAPTPTRVDFFSDRARGLLPPRNPDKVRYWEGLSVFATLAQARAVIATRKARASAQGIAWPVECVAEVTIARDGPITYEEWGRNAGHHTLWGDPDRLLAAVTGIFAGTDKG